MDVDVAADDGVAGEIEDRAVGDPDGAPVVLLHGLLMNDAQWDTTLPLLPAGFRYLLPVLPLGGHRIPMPAAADLTMPGMVGIVGDFLEALDLTDVTLVISDWGGPLFLTDMGRDKRVGRLVICPCEAFDNFPPGSPGKAAALATRTDASLRVSLAMLGNRRLRALRPIFGTMAKHPVPQGIVDAWLTHARTDRRVRRDLAKYCRTRFDAADLIRATGRLTEFPGPALVLWSENPVMPARHGSTLARLIRGGRLVRIDDAHVLVMLDQPERTAAAIGQFLQE